MIQGIHTILKQYHILFHLNQDVTIASVANSHEGLNLTKEILYTTVDQKTVLYLSGGSTPKTLYQKLAEEETLIPGGVGLVDERFGKPFHDTSNEKMIRESGLLKYLSMRDIPFYSILQAKDREQTAESYDEKLRTLHAGFQKSVAILGIGADGHTSSIIPNRSDFTNPMFDETKKHLLVAEFNDPKSSYKERVGMTFLGLEMQDLLFILAFGEEKKKALELMFSNGKEGLRQAQAEQEIPARFFTRPEIAKKTLLITDQKI